MPPEETLRIERLVCAALALVVLCGAPVMAQEYPNKPVRIVVGFAAGSVSDLTARALAQKLGSALGQPFVVEVRPGAPSGLRPSSLVMCNTPVEVQFTSAWCLNYPCRTPVRSPKDGYTLLVATSSSTLRSPSSAGLGFDFATDLTPIALIANVPFVLTAYPGLAVNTVQEFISLARSKPEALTFGGTAVGTTGHLAAQLFNQRAGTRLPIASYPRSRSHSRRQQTSSS
jgi:tripartite-type tricarboxylate transporter receptor subunit TctC